MTRETFALVVATCLLALQGCATAPATAPAPAAPATAPASPAPRPVTTLTAERHWLQSWFEGTPVRIVQQSESAFSIEVPRTYCFDPGSSVVKPPLGAVLDKLAQSLLRKPAARVEMLAAPGDTDAVSPLAQRRADNVRRHLIARGVSSAQLGVPSVTTVAAVQLHVGVAAP